MRGPDEPLDYATGDVRIVERRIVGDPLVFTPPKLPELPSTKLMRVVRELPRVHHVNDREQWPYVPDAEPMVMANLRPGYVAWVRTRHGVRQYLVRTVNVSRERRNHGRHFMVGMDRQAMCHSIWVDRVIRVEPLTKALKAGPRPPLALPRGPR